jgi:cytochrome bd-type quinol oxidase subunit 1
VKKSIIPFKKRHVFHVVFAAIATVLFALVTALLWYLVATGARDFFTILEACVVTVGLGCSLMALVTGRMAWLLIGLWESAGI